MSDYVNLTTFGPHTFELTRRLSAAMLQKGFNVVPIESVCEEKTVSRVYARVFDVLSELGFPKDIVTPPLSIPSFCFIGGLLEVQVAHFIVDGFSV